MSVFFGCVFRHVCVSDVFYGYPSVWYEGINVENAYYESGAAMARRDADLDFDYAAGIPKCELCTHCWDKSSYTE